ncbi:unnamed protein product [Aureobasidium vineae]|uniref:C2H2-type domain-containing protein n=1 Tax=Aureobasidium vineae TaxID=2773715 RepID=A0A9N8PGV0_9PEZI|nr:unnamed protein product [Aureobasidium vineae]
MDAIIRSDFMNDEVEHPYYPAFVINKPSEAPLMQDSAYSSPRPSSSWLSSESMSDSCSGTWSSPTPSVTYSPSPRPTDYRNHYSAWLQANSGHGMLPFTSPIQIQGQPDVSAYYPQELVCHPYYQNQCFQPQVSEGKALETFGLGGWATIEGSQAHPEHIMEPSPAPSSTITPSIKSSNDSSKQPIYPFVKQEEPAEYHHICSNPSPRKQQANKAKTAYPCPFLPYGCPASFSSKNEWKRHLNTQHLSLSTYRCGLCVPKLSASSTPPQTNDFNRKDLFIQHLRRMHCESSSESTSTVSNIKTARYNCIPIPNTPESLSGEADRCYIAPPLPPACTQCIFCCSTFSGPQAWIQRTEHISHHLERLRRDGLKVPKVENWRRDVELERWCLEIGVLVLHRGRDGVGRVRVKSGRRV